MRGKLPTTLDLGALGEVEIEIEYDYTPGTAPYTPAGECAPTEPGDPEVIEVYYVRRATPAGYVHCSALESLVELVDGFSLEEHFADQIREHAVAASKPDPDRDRD